MNGNHQNSHAHDWRRRWLALIDQFVAAAESPASPEQSASRGLRVRQLSVSSGRVDATVHQRGAADCEITIHVTPLDDAQWEALIDLLAGQAAYSAQLLAGDMPKNADRMIERAGISLFPTTADELRFGCSCHHNRSDPCPATLAVTAAVGEMLDDDPWLLFRLRGRERQTLLRMYQARRSRISGVGGDALDADAAALVYRSGDGADSDSAPALAEELNSYWGRAREQLDMQHVIAPPLVETALLRRLGPAHFDADGGAQAALSQVYRLVTDHGLALAFASEPELDAEADSDAAGAAEETGPPSPSPV